MHFLAQSRGPLFGEAVFLCSGGRRHFVRDLAIIEALGFSWPGDVRQLRDEELAQLRPAQLVPRSWIEHFPSAPPGVSSHDMREIMAANVTGVGIEIGAYDSPFPLPIECCVFYVDALDYDDAKGGAALDRVIPTMRARFEDLGAVAESSCDFVVASHVIEHTRDPIGAILGAIAKLRPGGSLLLVVPDKEHTFDRARELTSLDHLIADHEAPSDERDEAHYREYYQLAVPVPEADYERTWRAWAASRHPIHYHVWTPQSFALLTDYIAHLRGDIAVTTHPTLVETGGFEFYVKIDRLVNSEPPYSATKQPFLKQGGK
jgi:SAM-dependent methyltransferase